MTFKFDYKEPNIIAEIGCNHMGSLEFAKELIDLAKASGVKYVKFQKRNNRELLQKSSITPLMGSQKTPMEIPMVLTENF